MNFHQGLPSNHRRDTVRSLSSASITKDFIGNVAGAFDEIGPSGLFSFALINTLCYLLKRSKIIRGVDTCVIEEEIGRFDSNDIMSSISEVWIWLFAVVFLILLSFLVPPFSSKRVRYYACYICYCLNVSLVGFILTPFFMLKPRNAANFTVYGKCCKHLTKFIGVSWTLRNEHRLALQHGVVVVANHQTILDVLGMFNIADRVGSLVVVGKKELLFFPGFGLASWLAGQVFINRRKNKEAMKIIRKESRAARDLKRILWIYPEGTRNKSGEPHIQPFKMGAFVGAIDSQLPILPVVFSHYYFIDHRAKTFNRGEVIISVLEEISTEGLTDNDAAELMNKVQRLMSEEYDRLQKEMKVRYGAEK